MMTPRPDIGPKIGSGIHRDVFALLDDPTKVVKISRAGHGEDYFSNVLEWSAWQAAPPAWSKVLAPCHEISPCGQWMIQSRTEPLAADADLPDWWVYGDRKPSSFGLLHGRLVCHDYGSLAFITNGLNHGTPEAAQRASEDEDRLTLAHDLRRMFSKGALRITSYSPAFTAKTAREAVEKALVPRE